MSRVGCVILVSDLLFHHTNLYPTFSGSQATAATGFRPRSLSVRLSFLVFTSHTVTEPRLLPVTIIWGTFLFQSKHSKSSALPAAFGRPVPRRNGLAILLMSEINIYALLRPWRASRCLMHTSPCAPAVAKSSDRNGLNCSVLTAPVCVVVRDTKESLKRVRWRLFDVQ